MEDDQQFCLRWNNHQSTLIQNFDTLLESGTLVDCTLAAEGKYLKAHKVVLSACSPYFEGLLSEHYDKHPVFILKDVKFKELKAMMDYMYRGEVNISQDQLAALLKAAESLQIKGLSESKTSGSSKTDLRQQKIVPQVTAAPCDIPQGASGLTIEKNKVPRQGLAQVSVGDLPEDSASPQIQPKGLSSREGSQSPTGRKRKRFRRRSIGEDNNSMENHEASNSNDMSQQVAVPALGIAPVADETAHVDPADSIGRSALMTQLTKPADEMLQLPLEKPEPNDNLLEPKSEYMDDAEENVEDLTLDDDLNDMNEMEPDNNRAGPSHDPSQHPAGLGAWHVTGDRSNAGGVVGSVAGAPGTTDEVFLAAQEAAQAHRDSQESRSNKRRLRKRVSFVIIKSDSDGRPTQRWFRCGDIIEIDQDMDQGIIELQGNSKDLNSNNTVKIDKRSITSEVDSNENIRETIARSTDANANATVSASVGATAGETIGATYVPNEVASTTRTSDTSTDSTWPSQHSQDDNSVVNCDEWIDSDERGFECGYCHVKVRQKGVLTRHIRLNCLKNPESECVKHRSQRFVCSVCGRRFVQLKVLRYHIRSECGQKFRCPLCKLTFAKSTRIKRHMKICRRRIRLGNKRNREIRKVIARLRSRLSSDED